MNCFSKSLSMLLTATVPALGTAPLLTSFMAADAAYAGNGHGNGNAQSREHGGRGNGQENAKNEDTARGEIARELKGMNAMHASETALEAAAQNSRVGQIAIYRDMAQESGEAFKAWQSAYLDYRKLLDGYTGRKSGEIEVDIAALDETSETYEADLKALMLEFEAAQDHEWQLAEAAQLSNGAMQVYENATVAEADALETLTGGGVLSEAALAEFRTRLGL